MDDGARGEVMEKVVLHDEDGQSFVFLPLRVLRDGADLFLLAEREGAGTIHVLSREGDGLGLVRDDAVLRRVALRLEILRRAMEGELVEWTDEEGQERFLGVFHEGEAEGEPYLLAADLDDPARIVAFKKSEAGLEPVDERRRIAIVDQLLAATEEWAGALPNLESMTLGMRRERIEVTDARGSAHAYRAAGRFFFQGRDLLFLSPAREPQTAVAFEVKGGGRIEPVADERFLADLHAHLENPSRTAGSAS